MVTVGWWLVATVPRQGLSGIRGPVWHTGQIYEQVRACPRETKDGSAETNVTLEHGKDVIKVGIGVSELGTNWRKQQEWDTWKHTN